MKPSRQFRIPLPREYLSTVHEPATQMGSRMLTIHRRVRETVEGKVIGAIGASGDSPQEDEEIALAGAGVTASAVQEEGR